MRRLVALLLLLAAGPAAAGLTQADLAAVGVRPGVDARLPADLRLDTADGRSLTVAAALGGRPTLLLPIDAQCRSTCGPALALLAGALDEAGLVPGRDLSLVVVAIGRPETARYVDAARALVAAQGGPDLATRATLLVGPSGGVARLADAVGLRVSFDEANDAVAHPSALLALAADGRVTRVLSSLAVNPIDLRLAVTEAGEGRSGTLGDRLRLLCYGFDPVHGVYTARVWTALRLGGALIVVLLAGGLWWMAAGRRRFASPAPHAGAGPGNTR